MSIGFRGGCISPEAMMTSSQYTDAVWNSSAPALGIPPQAMGVPGMYPPMGAGFLTGPAADVFGEGHGHDPEAGPHEKNTNYLLYGALAVVGAIGLWKGGNKLKAVATAIPGGIKGGFTKAKTFVAETFHNIAAKFKKS